MNFFVNLREKLGTVSEHLFWNRNGRIIFLQFNQVKLPNLSILTARVIQALPVRFTVAQIFRWNATEGSHFINKSDLFFRSSIDNYPKKVQFFQIFNDQSELTEPVLPKVALLGIQSYCFHSTQQEMHLLDRQFTGKRGKDRKKKKKGQHLASIEPTTSRLQDACSTAEVRPRPRCSSKFK